jgi:hypothetical protein
MVRSYFLHAPLLHESEKDGGGKGTIGGPISPMPTSSFRSNKTPPCTQKRREGTHIFVVCFGKNGGIRGCQGQQQALLWSALLLFWRKEK